jgi:hypothetical protein
MPVMINIWVLCMQQMISVPWHTVYWKKAISGEAEPVALRCSCVNRHLKADTWSFVVSSHKLGLVEASAHSIVSAQILLLHLHSDRAISYFISRLL